MIAILISRTDKQGKEKQDRESPSADLLCPSEPWSPGGQAKPCHDKRAGRAYQRDGTLANLAVSLSSFLTIPLVHERSSSSKPLLSGRRSQLRFSLLAGLIRHPTTCLIDRFRFFPQHRLEESCCFSTLCRSDIDLLMDWSICSDKMAPEQSN